MRILTSDKLHALSGAICAASGSIEQEAILVADHLVEANLTVHGSHPLALRRRSGSRPGRSMR